MANDLLRLVMIWILPNLILMILTGKEFFMPGTWEDQGFPGYDGYAWYRIRFQMPTQYNNKTLVLKLGYIELIGTWI